MHIVIVGGGTAGWATALMAATRWQQHKVTVIESTKIGVIGVGESTTGRLTDLVNNFFYDFGCNHDEFIAETGATLKYSIKHKGWTNNVDEFYQGPIDGSWTNSASPDALFAYGIANLSHHDGVGKTSKIGHRILAGGSNFNKTTNTFNDYNHAMHVDAHLVGKYFKKVCLRNNLNANHIDSEVVDVKLHGETGFIESVLLKDGRTIEGDFFIDCSGFAKVLMNKLPNQWISYQKNLPINTGLPFQLKYLDNEMPEPYTTAWAQKSGWMWQIPLMDRKGCGYVFSDEFTTPDKAQEEIEIILGREIDPIKVIKFHTGRQDNAWVKNCITIGLSSAFLEPLEATSIHTTIVQAHNFVFEYCGNTLEETVNEGSMKIYNQRTKKMFDDVKDFLVMHYMGGRSDSEFWKYIGTGATKTDFVESLLSMSKTRLPSSNDFPQYQGSAGWALYSFVMAGLHMFDSNLGNNALQQSLPRHGSMADIALETFYELQWKWDQEVNECYSYNDFIKYFRQLRYKNGFSDIKY